MSYLVDGQKGDQRLFMGNEAIARGALEAGVSVVAGYPGTPSSEIIENLAKVSGERNLYVEWSTNEKVALEVAAAASFAGLRALCAMKQNGVNVASDFLLHLAITGTRAGMVLVPCDDPGALSSANEGESRQFARLMEIPLLEPGDFQEAKDMIKWAFELSEEIRNLVMVRSVTRLSHASGKVVLGELPETRRRGPFSNMTATFLDPLEGPVVNLPVILPAQPSAGKAQERSRPFSRTVPFNTYTGPESPELLLITSSACNLYSREAIQILGVGDRVGLLKLGTTWPLPSKLMEKHLARTDKILIVEEVIPFLEDNVKILAAELAAKIGIENLLRQKGWLHSFHRGVEPRSGHCAAGQDPGNRSTSPCRRRMPNGPRNWPSGGARPRIWPFVRAARTAPLSGPSTMSWRWTTGKGFVCGDIGCYSMGLLPTGFRTLKTPALHGIGNGCGQRLRQAGQVRDGSAGAGRLSGDSTFFHAVPPGPDQRGAQQVGHHPGASGQQRHGHDRVSAPSGASHGCRPERGAGHRHSQGL